ncbi:MAG: hypothetical protein ACLTSZ_07195 [Lachnospiraceae bacterium]
MHIEIERKEEHKWNGKGSREYGGMTVSMAKKWRGSCVSFPLLDAERDYLVHGFSTRIGGVSEGIYRR